MEKESAKLVKKHEAEKEAYEKLDEEGKAAADIENAKNYAKGLIEGDTFEFILIEECGPDDPEFPMSFDPFVEYAIPAFLLSFYALGEEEPSLAVAKRLFEIWDSTNDPLAQNLQYYSEEEKNRIWQTLEKYILMAVAAREEQGIDAYEDWINKSVLNFFKDDIAVRIYKNRFKTAMDIVKQEYRLSERQDSIFDVIEFSE